ncbi:MAG: efflux RND transporter permease subunit [Bacteroidales bacterium]
MLNIPSGILRYRFFIIAIVLAITAVMGFFATRVEMSYENKSLVPKQDEAYKNFEEFHRVFGEEGSVMVMGIEDKDFFQLKHFNAWKKLSDDISKVEGVDNALSIPDAYNLDKNTQDRKFEIIKVFPDNIDNQRQLDSCKEVFLNLPIYDGFVYNKDANVFMLAITLDGKVMASNARVDVVAEIMKIAKDFENKENITIHYSGMPYIKVIMAEKIKKETYLFSSLALLLCIIFLFVFFRSFKAVIYPVIIVLICVVWSLGLMGLLQYKITLLTSMIPPLLIVIGMPNSIYMLNKFHHEYREHQNKIKALYRVITKIGKATLLTNLTTACGFATFMITKSAILIEFGIVASLSIFSLFILSLVLIPTIFSYVEEPRERHMKHLDYKSVSLIVERVFTVLKHRRKVVFIVSVILLVVAGFGLTRMQSTGYMVDDIEESDIIYKDLKFFEKNFVGLMPMEIIVETEKARGGMDLNTWQKLDAFDNYVDENPDMAKSLSILNAVKMARQAYYNGLPKYYGLPNSYDKNMILPYLAKVGASSANDAGSNIMDMFIDSTRSKLRYSVRVKDIGVKPMDELYNELNTKAAEIFPSEQYKVMITGSSVMFFVGMKYLISNLILSLGLAIVLIGILIAVMFKSPKMIVVSVLTNIFPLLLTAAVMGYFNIPIKASTILVFSIAYGISVDNSIHFLSKFRQDMKITGGNTLLAIRMALRETGVSMIYTAVVLFFGFFIFSLSSFGGTSALGVLVSFTLLVALLCNLLLLPSILILTRKKSELLKK